MERKTKIIFVCHGNICRSPMAEYIFKNMLKERNITDKFDVTSRALSYEEVGNDIYPPVKRILNFYQIPYSNHHAQVLTNHEVEQADFIILMDENNVRWFLNRFGQNNKTKKLLHYSNSNLDVSDPWYSDKFEECYQIIKNGLNNFLNYLLNIK